MKTAALILALAFLAACNPSTPEDGGKTFDVETPAFAYGADVSWVSEMEAGGKGFKKQDGSTADIFEVLKDVGINSIRLRVWVNPTGGWSGKDDVVALAVRAAKAGMALMIDFHYSDFFADPSRQDFPAAWAADKGDVEKTVVHIREHTAEVLAALKDAGVAPAWIQIGNETISGFLWPLGKIDWNSSAPWDNFVMLYKAGYESAKGIFPDALVMPHLNNAFQDRAWWFKELKQRGGSFDAMALSHYPQTESGKTADQVNAAAINSIKKMAAESTLAGIPVIIAEVGVKVSTESASAAVLQSFMDEVRKLSVCKGVFYWEPEVYGGWKPAVYNSLGWGSYGMGAFTSDGRPSSIMNAFKH